MNNNLNGLINSMTEFMNKINENTEKLKAEIVQLKQQLKSDPNTLELFLAAQDIVEGHGGSKVDRPDYWTMVSCDKMFRLKQAVDKLS